MALQITEQSVKETPKGFRADVTVVNSSFFGGKTETKFFFMGAGQLNESLIPTVAKEVLDKQDEWKPGKRSQTLPLETLRSTAIITKHNELD